MRENVGRNDQLIRSIAGPALIAVGYFALGGRKGKIGGILTIMAGTFVTESAITEVCPVNYLLGIDTREKKSPLKKSLKGLKKVLK